MTVGVVVVDGVAILIQCPHTIVERLTLATRVDTPGDLGEIDESDVVDLTDDALGITTITEVEGVDPRARFLELLLSAHTTACGSFRLSL